MHPGFSLCWSCDKAGTGYPAAEIANTSPRWSDQLPMNPAPRSAFPGLIPSFKCERDKKKTYPRSVGSRITRPVYSTSCLTTESYKLQVGLERL